ncbi:MAG TPA: DUF2892 domain-containing protein [Gemmatimonadales bacterium]|jgi:hypothetical protein|nr:DUF2892 domain-containing protein [Gemmatimonadales bacterium]
MRRNVGWAGRVVRILIAVLVLGLYGALLPPWKYLTLLGLIPLASGLTGFDPLTAWLALRRGGRANAR